MSSQKIRRMAISLFSAIALVVLAFTTVIPAASASVAGNPTPNPTCSTPAPTWTGSPTITPAFGYNPCPTPTPTPTCPLFNAAGIPQPLVAGEDLAACPRIYQQDFGGTDTNVNPQGFVVAQGPVFFRFARDITISPTLDLFRQAFLGSILVHHGQVFGGAVVDREACTITADNADIPWYVLRGQGTGLYRNDTGAGVVDVVSEFSYPTRDFTCTLPATLTSGQATWDLNDHGIGLPTPYDFSVSFNGTGWIAPRSVVRPYPTPTYSISG